MPAPRRTAVALALLAVACCLPSAPAGAQQPDLRTQLANLPIAMVSGKVVGYEGDKIFMKTATEAPYIIQVVGQPAENPISQVQVIGTAPREFLAAGMFLRFSAPEMDKKGTAKGDLTELAIFEPSEAAQPGVSSDDPELKEGPFFIAGQIKSITKTGKATINTGRLAVKATIPEDAVIELLVSNYQLAREGDEITVSGRLVQQAQVGEGETKPALVVGETIDIKLIEPATLPGKKPKPRKPKPTTEGEGDSTPAE
jgi:hypothetical protein